MTEKRYSHDGVVIVDHLKEDLIYIDGNENLLDLAEYVDILQYENEQLKQQVEDLEFKLRTIKTFNRTVKEEHSESVYDFQKKLEKW